MCDCIFDCCADVGFDPCGCDDCPDPACWNPETYEDKYGDGEGDLRLYLIEPVRSPDRRAVIAAPSAEAACRMLGVDPQAARVKDQTRFMVRNQHQQQGDAR